MERRIQNIIILILVIAASYLIFQDFEEDESNEEFNGISLIIGEEEGKVLQDNRDHAIDLGYIIDPIPVPMTLLTPEGEFTGMIRLKGDYTDHLKGDTWSYRVELDDEATWRGMNRFSLQHPSMRANINEVVFHEVLAHEGILDLDYFFTELRINDADMGVYAVEEHFSRNYLSHHDETGFVLRFDDNDMWDLMSKDSILTMYEYFMTSDIDAYGDRYLKKDTARYATVKEVEAKLERWRMDSLRGSELFHYEHMAQFLALCDLLSAYHATEWFNLRFWYDPEHRNLEPIGFDAEIWELMPTSLKMLAIQNNKTVLNNFFQDSLFMVTYNDVMSEYLVPGKLESILDDIDPEIQAQLELLNARDEGYTYDRNMFIEKREILREGDQ